MSLENFKVKRINQLLEMITQNPNDLFVKYALAMEYASSEDKSMSIQLLSEIIEKDKNYVSAYYQLGLLHIANGLNQKALEFFETGFERAREIGSDRKTLNEFKSMIDELMFE